MSIEDEVSPLDDNMPPDDLMEKFIADVPPMPIKAEELPVPNLRALAAAEESSSSLSSSSIIRALFRPTCPPGRDPSRRDCGARTQDIKGKRR